MKEFNLENCTFTDIWENAINNTGNLKIVNSNFENIKAIYTNPKIFDNKHSDNGLIYNTGTLTIENSNFKNIANPN